jgi:hypothetical protein
MLLTVVAKSPGRCFIIMESRVVDNGSGSSKSTTAEVPQLTRRVGNYRTAAGMSRRGQFLARTLARARRGEARLLLGGIDDKQQSRGCDSRTLPVQTSNKKFKKIFWRRSTAVIGRCCSCGIIDQNVPWTNSMFCVLGVE